MAEESMLTKAARGTSVLAIQGIINTLLGAALYMFIARAITKEEMGIYGGLGLVISITSTAGSLGLGAAASRFTSHLRGQNDMVGMRSAAKCILLLSSASATILALSYFAFSFPLSSFMFGTSTYSSVFHIASLVVFANILASVFCGFLTGLQRFSHLAIFRFMAQLAKMIFTVWLLMTGLSVIAVFLGSAVFYISITIMAIPITMGLLFKTSGSKNNTVFSIKPLLFFSLPMMVYSLASFASSSIDSFIVLTLLSVEALGTYSVAMNASVFAMSIFGVPLATTLMPSMSEIQGRSGIDEVASLLTLASRYIALFFIPISLGLAILSPLAIEILAGPAYAEAALPLAITSLGLSAYGFSTAIISSLTAIGKTVKVMIVFLMSLGVELIACIGFTPLFGVVGTALGRAIMYIFMLFLLVRIGSASILISFDKRALFSSLASSSTMALILYPVSFFTNFSITLLSFYIVLGVIVYGLALLYTKTLTSSDILFLCSLFPGGELLLPRLEKIANKPFMSRIVRKFFDS